MRIFLVRHGQSIANADKSIHLHMADHAIPLSRLGEAQALRAGLALSEYLKRSLTMSATYPRLWTSPYKRARQTADLIQQNCRFISDRREHILLCEQQFGLFDGISHEGTKNEILERYPDEYHHYKKCEEFEGAFWARMPLGESKFDLAVRVHQAFGTFQRDAQKHGINDIIIVAHGSTNRAFAMMWLHHPFEWFEKEPNPKNCSIRLIEDNVDRGYIYEGGYMPPNAEELKHPF